MRQRPYLEVDVFTATAYLGNPLAVVVDAGGLDGATMQRFANWTNLSESAFLLPPRDPAADYELRIFTPARELPFAGHPTLGGCHAWLAAGGVPRDPQRIVQQCGVGLVTLRPFPGGLAFRAPALRRAAVDEPTRVAALGALGLPPERLRAAAWLDNGPRWLGLLLDSASTVLALEPDPAALRLLGLVGVIGPWDAPRAGDPHDPCDFEVRAFTSSEGIAEDPVTGSLNAALAQWLIGTSLAPPRYRVAQGTRLQRAGRVAIDADDAATVWVGGACVTCVEGSVPL